MSIYGWQVHYLFVNAQVGWNREKKKKKKSGEKKCWCLLTSTRHVYCLQFNLSHKIPWISQSSTRSSSKSSIIYSLVLMTWQLYAFFFCPFLHPNPPPLNQTQKSVFFASQSLPLPLPQIFFPLSLLFLSQTQPVYLSALSLSILSSFLCFVLYCSPFCSASIISFGLRSSF